MPLCSVRPFRRYRKQLQVLLLLAGLGLVACAPPPSGPTLPAPTPITPSPAAALPTMTPSSPSPTPSEPAGSLLSSLPAQAAVRIAAAELGLSPDAITVESVEELDWPDASLGCPQPGMLYAQVITPGHRVIVVAGGRKYAVHLDANGRGRICRK